MKQKIQTLSKYIFVYMTNQKKKIMDTSSSRKAGDRQGKPLK